MSINSVAEFLLAGQSDFVWCPQGAHVVMKEDFEPRAGMCGSCIGEAMADAGEFFVRRGLVASFEENEAND